MGRKRKYDSAMRMEDDISGPYLESINLPDENYYRNMTESPIELAQPHMSTNPIKHGVNRTNMNHLLSIQDKYNNSHVIPKMNRRKLISANLENEDNVERVIHENNYSQNKSNIDILNDDLSLKNRNINSNFNNIRSRLINNSNENVISQNKDGCFVRRKIEKGSSNLPPLPRTEDYWPKINRDGIQEHEDYLNSIRNKHLNKKKPSEEFSSNNFYHVQELNNHPYKDIHNNNDNHFTREIYSMETPLKSSRSEISKLVVENQFNDKKIPNNNFNLKRSNILSENEILLSQYNSKFNNNPNSNIDKQNMVTNAKSINKSKNFCDAMVGGDTPLRKFYPEEASINTELVNMNMVETSDIGVGPSPKPSECKDINGNQENKCSKSESKVRISGNISRKSVGASVENSKQVKFSSKKSVQIETIPEIEELNFDPSEVPLIEYDQDKDFLDLTDLTGDEISENKILDSFSVDNNIFLRLVQLSKEEIRLFESGISDSEKNKDIYESKLDKELMTKAISGIHRYFLNKVIEYESQKDLQLDDIAIFTQEFDYGEDKNRSINLEREELINKIGLLNLNINRLTAALKEAELLNSKLNNSKLESTDNEYIMACTNQIIDSLSSEGLEKVNDDVDKSDTSDLSSPTPVLSNDSNLSSSKVTKSGPFVDELLKECHQSQFIQMESIAILNDCMSLLDDAEVGMQNFQKLLARKAFDTQEDDINYSANDHSNIEDTFLKIQKGSSITPRFSLEDGLHLRNSVGTGNRTGSRKSTGMSSN